MNKCHLTRHRRFPPRNWTEKDLFPYCAKVYDVVPNPEWLLQEYGSGNISTSATNIIFSNGLLDPWHVGGFLANLSDSLPAVVIAVCGGVRCVVGCDDATGRGAPPGSARVESAGPAVGD